MLVHITHAITGRIALQLLMHHPVGHDLERESVDCFDQVRECVCRGERGAPGIPYNVSWSRTV